ncbi:MAG: transcriptional repressor [Clostridia bacterium]|nr:transcriptional repressor [Clostridia bacterium]MBC7346359.1 transcriptional repressor [Clostridia bacterium]
MREVVQRAEALLVRRAYRSTPQRRAIIAVLAAKKGEHLTAEEVFAAAKKTRPRIGLATVYRTLALLGKMGIVHHLRAEDGVSRYELSPAWRKARHHHLICLSCGSIREIEAAELDALYEKTALIHKFELVPQPLELWGYCQKCRAGFAAPR